ncbi:polysaccharide pyruvyl transferase family protein [Alkalihalobacillus sp. 1P02AB]|uniref:polysaccharide pyruvyl transferase family protein n=1 Tax=Alkalihalobacillus sp. 1P02AB TaxID=3132260 RepID=UPI0039A4E5C9
MEKNKLIALHGSYYHHNYGDILLMDIMRKWIKEYDEKIEVLLPYAQSYIAKDIGAERYGEKYLNEADAFIFGGGGYFGEPPQKKYLWGLRNIQRYSLPRKKLTKNNKPYAIIGVGAGPISNPLTRNSIVKTVRKAKFVAVRDEESKKFLIDNNVDKASLIETSDIVNQLSKDDIPASASKEAEEIVKSSEGQIKVGIHLGNFDNKEVRKVIIDEITKFSNENLNVSIFLICDWKGKYSDVTLELSERISRAVLVPYKDHWTFTALIGQLDLVLTTKLHVGIVSSALNKHAISIAAHSKTPRFYKQINASDRCIQLDDLREGFVYEKLSYYSFKKVNTQIIPNNIIQKSKRNKEILFNFLDSIYH